MSTSAVLLGLLAVFVCVVIVLAACRGLFSGLWPEPEKPPVYQDRVVDPDSPWWLER